MPKAIRGVATDPDPIILTLGIEGESDIVLTLRDARELIRSAQTIRNLTARIEALEALRGTTRRG